MHEGYCITLAEARAFKKPIVVTDFVEAREQIINGKTGIIVDFNEQKIFEQILNLLNNENLLRQFEKNFSIFDKDNATDINKLLRVNLRISKEEALISMTKHLFCLM